MSKEVKRYVPEYCESGGEIWAEMQEDSEGGWVRAADYDALLAERDRLREALNFSCKSLCQVTSSDGSGHADIALSVLRLAGVNADEREALVDGWKANVQWRTDHALQGEQPCSQR